jgi:hypothetical protein
MERFQNESLSFSVLAPGIFQWAMLTAQAFAACMLQNRPSSRIKKIQIVGKSKIEIINIIIQIVAFHLIIFIPSSGPMVIN